MSRGVRLLSMPNSIVWKLPYRQAELDAAARTKRSDPSVRTGRGGGQLDCWLFFSIVAWRIAVRCSCSSLANRFTNGPLKVRSAWNAWS